MLTIINWEKDIGCVNKILNYILYYIYVTFLRENIGLCLIFQYRMSQEFWFARKMNNVIMIVEIKFEREMIISLENKPMSNYKKLMILVM